MSEQKMTFNIYEDKTFDLIFKSATAEDFTKIREVVDHIEGMFGYEEPKSKKKKKPPAKKATPKTTPQETPKSDEPEKNEEIPPLGKAAEIPDKLPNAPSPLPEKVQTSEPPPNVLPEQAEEVDDSGAFQM